MVHDFLVRMKDFHVTIAFCELNRLVFTGYSLALSTMLVFTARYNTSSQGCFNLFADSLELPLGFLGTDTGDST
jgi:hypothetical protein